MIWQMGPFSNEAITFYIHIYVGHFTSLFRQVKVSFLKLYFHVTSLSNVINKAHNHNIIKPYQYWSFPNSRSQMFAQNTNSYRHAPWLHFFPLTILLPRTQSSVRLNDWIRPNPLLISNRTVKQVLKITRYVNDHHLGTRHCKNACRPPACSRL